LLENDFDIGILTAIIGKVEMLVDNPRLGRPINDNLFKFVVMGKNEIFYSIDGNKIYIRGVYAGGQDSSKFD
jgi:plasmid stabilization system protein ParE